MKHIALIALVALLTGCLKQAETSNNVGSEFVVDTLFTHEGCTVYRFNDGGNARYYTNCQGSTSWQRSCGKGCIRQEGVN